MSQLTALLKSFVPRLPSQQERDEEYLCEAVNVYDVERRMWEIDHRAAQPFSQAVGGVVH
jgi:hypothetical protein